MGDPHEFDRTATEHFRGGGRIGLWQATVPLATLDVDDEWLRLRVAPLELWLPKEDFGGIEPALFGGLKMYDAKGDNVGSFGGVGRGPVVAALDRRGWSAVRAASGTRRSTVRLKVKAANLALLGGFALVMLIAVLRVQAGDTYHLRPYVEAVLARQPDGVLAEVCPEAAARWAGRSSEQWAAAFADEQRRFGSATAASFRRGDHVYDLRVGGRWVEHSIPIQVGNGHRRPCPSDDHLYGERAGG
jgi:hypothetical protein